MAGDRAAANPRRLRDVIKKYTAGWGLPRLVALARRIVAELEVTGGFLADLTALLAEYDRGEGVGTPAKNLIFAANGPKLELVLRDAVNNDIEIVRNGEYCLVYDQPIPADGLTFSNLIEWWREHEGFEDTITARGVGVELHNRLRASLGNNKVELRVFDAYAARYKDGQFDIPALIPQVYLHFDPATQSARRSAGQSGSPMARQRMDFLILFSSRHRVVLEVDGKQHYANKRRHREHSPLQRDGLRGPTAQARRLRGLPVWRGRVDEGWRRQNGRRVLRPARRAHVLRGNFAS